MPTMRAYAYDSCLPTRVKFAPTGPQWLHEVKHDGYRLKVRRTPSGIRIRTRRGYDWTDRFPLIREAASRLRATSFVLDGAGAILRPDGVSDFDALHDGRRDREVQLLAFDLLELDGEDLRPDPLERGRALRACSNTISPGASMCSTTWMPSRDCAGASPASPSVALLPHSNGVVALRNLLPDLCGEFARAAQRNGAGTSETHFALLAVAAVEGDPASAGGRRKPTEKVEDRR